MIVIAADISAVGSELEVVFDMKVGFEAARLVENIGSNLASRAHQEEENVGRIGDADRPMAGEFVDCLRRLLSCWFIVCTFVAILYLWDYKSILFKQLIYYKIIYKYSKSMTRKQIFLNTFLFFHFLLFVSRIYDQYVYLYYKIVIFLIQYRFAYIFQFLRFIYIKLLRKMNRNFYQFFQYFYFFYIQTNQILVIKKASLLPHTCLYNIPKKKILKFKNPMQKLAQIYFNSFSTSSFRSLCFSPFPSHPPSSTPQNLAPIASQIFQWAKSHQARYYSFLAFPHTGSIAQKHESFLTLSHSLSHTFSTLKYSDMLKGQADGSSFPNGGLRSTHNARAYFVWDWRSQIFMRRRNGVVYLPALLVGHNGQMLDDKGGYRKAEAMLEKQCMELLKRIGIQSKGIFIGLGLEQQFFLIPKSHFNSRLDLSQTSRTLIPTVSPHNQQLSTHYYARLEPQIQNLLSECQSQLLQIGIPIKTRHKEVAPNQYQFCSVFQQASRAIDHNLMKMIVLGETAERYGYKALWHQKPFLGINGSGKHMNWSLNFFKGSTGKLRNLFAPEGYDDQLFLLFALIKLKAILLNQELYLASICTPGNELRLGGHEAPPRIFSTFLGQTVSSMLDKMPSPELINLKTLISHLATNLSQQDTDRNRTSPYAYTSNRFEFRAVGSSQNCYFPMTVILATVGAQIKNVNKRLAQGATVKQLIQEMTNQTLGIRFQGDGYSEKWIQQAKKRKLYVSQTFTQPISNLQTAGKVLVQTGVYTQNELQSKSKISRDIYIKTVQIQSKTLLTLINKFIIPRLYKLLQIVPKSSTSEPILRRSRKIQDVLQKLIIETEYLTEIDRKSKNQNIRLGESQKLRERIEKIGELAGEGLSFCGEDGGKLPEGWEIFGNH